MAINIFTYVERRQKCSQYQNVVNVQHITTHSIVSTQGPIGICRSGRSWPCSNGKTGTKPFVEMIDQYHKLTKTASM